MNKAADIKAVNFISETVTVNILENLDPMAEEELERKRRWIYKKIVNLFLFFFFFYNSSCFREAKQMLQRHGSISYETTLLVGDSEGKIFN